MATSTGWHRTLKGVHWLVAILLVMTWASVELHEFVEKGAPWRDRWVMLHISFGVTVLILMLFRLYLRVRHPTPPFIGAPWQRGLSQLVHLGLYLFVIAMPIAGFLMRQFAGKGSMIFGLGPMPLLLTPNAQIADILAWLHKGLLWYVLLALVGTHVAGALWHHFIDHDDTLRRMASPRR